MSVDDLRQPFARKYIEQKPGANGRKDDFVNHAVVTNRLNLVLGLDWSYTIDRIIEDADGTHVKAVLGTLSVRDIENNVTSRTETGSPDRASNYGDDLKNSISDFVKRAAMRYGVGIQLWHEVEASVARAEVPTGVQGNGEQVEGGSDAYGEGVTGSPSTAEGLDGPTLLDQLYKVYGNGNKVLIAARKLYADVAPPNSLSDLTEERMQELLERV